MRISGHNPIAHNLATPPAPPSPRPSLNVSPANFLGNSEERIARHDLEQGLQNFAGGGGSHQPAPGPGGPGGPHGPGGPGQGPQAAGENKSFTDPNGNTVTRTNDGYTVIENPDGSTKTLTPGGYAVDYDPNSSTLTMTNMRTKESTTVFGDPHVAESDGGGSYWDYDQATSSFVLADGTKITTEATSANGTLTDVDIYSGKGLTHVSQDANGTTVSSDRFAADAQQSDGTVYYGSVSANDWYRDPGRTQEVASVNAGFEGLPYFGT